MQDSSEFCQARVNELKPSSDYPMKTLLVTLFCLTLAACAGGYNPRYYYSNIEVANLSGGTITNVEVQIGVDGRNLRCESVAKNALCQERFGKRPYPQQDIQLSWQDSEGNLQSTAMNPHLPATLSPSWALRIMLDILEDGSVKAYFKQDQSMIGALDIVSKPAG
jgi:hypothetical protein